MKILKKVKRYNTILVSYKQFKWNDENSIALLNSIEYGELNTGIENEYIQT